MAPGGMETPVRRYSSAFQLKWTNSSPSLRASLSRSRMRIPAAMTSGPMPSPATAGPITITATVTSSTTDSNPANNTASLTLTVSTDPDLEVSLTAPARQDLGLPFTLGIGLANVSKSDAHNVDVTVDFRSDVAVATLPAGCVSLAAGRVVCHADVVSAGQSAVAPLFTVGLVAPAQYGGGTIAFTAVATEAEHDFDPATNTTTLTTTLNSTFYVPS